MKNVDLWGVNIPSDLLSEADEKYLQGLPISLPTVEWVRGEIDRVWDNYDLNNRCALADQTIAQFYGHPVWLMSGVFSSLDAASKKIEI